MAQHEAARHTAPQRTTMQCATARRPKTRHTTARRGATRHSAAHHGRTRRNGTRHSRAHRNTTRASTTQHGETRHDTAWRTRAHHNTKASNTNRGSNPTKPPHTPEGAAPAHHAPARGHGAPGNDGGGLPTRTAARVLIPASRGRRDTRNPSPPCPGPLETAWCNRPAGRARTYPGKQGHGAKRVHNPADPWGRGKA